MSTNTLSRKDVAEGAPYDHPDHGRVVVTLVDDDSGVVYHEQPDQRLTNSQFTEMHSDNLDTFRRIAEPLPQTLDVPDAMADADTNMGGI